MIAEINRINQVLLNATADYKAEAIRQWMESAKLGEKEEKAVEERAKHAKVDTASARKERRITCGADIVIKNVLPFLELK
eukprot:scaffold17313_cov91-Skeletonema_marinoi.AAC.3